MDGVLRMASTPASVARAAAVGADGIQVTLGRGTPLPLSDPAVQLQFVVMRAIRDIDFEGYAMLETSSPSANVDEDVKRNLAYARQMFEQAQRRPQ